MLQKYFIAIVPPEPLLTQLHEFKLKIFADYGTKGALLSPPHITLHMPFSWEEEKEGKLLKHLADFEFESNINIELNNFNCFEPRVVFVDVLPNDSLLMLQKTLVKYAKLNLHLYNQADDIRGFHPHVTVAFRDLKKPVFYKVWEEYKNKKFSASFNCCSFCLLKHNGKSWDIHSEFDFMKRKMSDG